MVLSDTKPYKGRTFASCTITRAFWSGAGHAQEQRFLVEIRQLLWYYHPSNLFSQESMSIMYINYLCQRAAKGGETSFTFRVVVESDFPPVKVPKCIGFWLSGCLLKGAGSSSKESKNLLGTLHRLWHDMIAIL